VGPCCRRGRLRDSEEPGIDERQLEDAFRGWLVAIVCDDDNETSLKETLPEWPIVVIVRPAYRPLHAAAAGSAMEVDGR